MICSENDTFHDIIIPSVLLPKAAGEHLEEALDSNNEGKFNFHMRLIVGR